MNVGRSRGVALSLLVLLTFVPGLGRAASTRGAQAPAAGIGTLRICTSCARTGGDLSRYGYVILNAWDAPMIPSLKAANPGLTALVYKNLSFTEDYACTNGVDDAQLSTGVGYCDANAGRPDWFLRDTSGARIASTHYPSAWLMDVGNASYQDRWLANVSSDLKAHGWDGVFADDTDASMAWHLGGRTIARYPTGAAWRAATRSMLARVGPALRSQGFLVVPNVSAPWSSDYDAPALWKDWLQFTSGAAQEYYTKWGTGSSGWLVGGDWTYRQQFQAITESAGKLFLGLTYAPKSDVRSMLYARASFLLFDGGHGALVFEGTDPEAQDPYAPQWTLDVGTPTSARYAVGPAWRRDFTGGTVLANPSAAAVTVPLGRAFRTADGSSVNVVTLQPATGTILRSDSAAAPVRPQPFGKNAR